MSGPGPAAGAQGAAAGDPAAAARGPGVVVGVLGPTAVGKTAVAMELARLFGTRVVSCDSMQVYGGFPVLTNQPSPAEREAARHELVGCAEPLETFSAARYADAARPLVEEDLREKGRAVVAGGTGLYMRAALAPLDTRPPADPRLRAALETRAREEGSEVLYAELARLDPAAAERIDARNVRRVVRALEAVSTSGSWSGREDLWTPAYRHPTVIVGLTLERAELYRRIDARSARMLEEGAVDEVRAFRMGYGVDETRPGGAGVRSAIGYREICLHLDGHLTAEETAASIAAATRRYARRQLTWLRRVEGAVIIDVGDRSPHGIAQEIAALAASRESAWEPDRA
ncbi:MAG: tRNA (adenosine(37)-N6)-dimethylallyltransferase MiaA [Thermoleophilia bacterium]|nr:tRNA (adenosine(37)-N6)-dimethylallyltransferase MiaA [Thermoleophilia bacterium]